VTITQGKQRNPRHGLEIDNRTGITVLHGRVTGTLHQQPDRRHHERILFDSPSLPASPAPCCDAPARAEKADRDKPVNIEADRVSVDDVKKVQTFEGNVQLVKGTLIIRAERIVVTAGRRRLPARRCHRHRRRAGASGRSARAWTNTSRARPSASSTTPGPKRPSSSTAPGSRAASTKFAASSFPTMR
jgi:hypothetical protein